MSSSFFLISTKSWGMMFMLQPVAVTMMSASSSWPDCKRMPFSVKRSMWSVTTEALPSAMPWNMSPSGMKAKRWRQDRAGERGAAPKLGAVETTDRHAVELGAIGRVHPAAHAGRGPGHSQHRIQEMHR